MLNKKLLFCSLITVYCAAEQTNSLAEYMQAFTDLETHASGMKIEQETFIKGLSVRTSERVSLTSAAQRAYNKYTQAHGKLELSLSKRAIITGMVSGLGCATLATLFSKRKPSIEHFLCAPALIGTALGTVMHENNKLGKVPYFELDYKNTHTDEKEGIYRGYKYLDKKENLCAHMGINSFNRYAIHLTSGLLSMGGFFAIAHQLL